MGYFEGMFTHVHQRGRGRRFLSLGLLTLAGLAGTAGAQVVSRDRSFAGLANNEFPKVVENGDGRIRPSVRSAWTVDVEALRRTLASAPREFSPEAATNPVVIELPMPGGGLEPFVITNSPVMEPGLAAKFPDIMTFQAVGANDPSMVGRLDITPLGFHAMIFTGEGTFYVEPYNRFDPTFAVSFWRRDVGTNPGALRCEVGEHTPDNNPAPAGGWGVGKDGQLHSGASVNGGTVAARSGAQRRTYRLALAGTSEWVTAQGGAALAQAQMVTTANRVSGIYDKDFCIRFTLVANNNLLMYTNATTDPYSNGSASTMLTQNQTAVDGVILSANYDLGHVVGTASSPNGVAGAIGNGCVAGSKARGVSLVGTGSPYDDFFIVDYVAHEMGHQMGGRHIFNSCSGSQGDSSTLAVEPGSGSTIMSYAGICPSSTPNAGDNLQPHNDDYFNAINIDQIVAYTTSGGGGFACAATSATGNNPPSGISAGSDFAIPPSTPFVLTATGTDPDGNALTWCWEQADGGTARSLSTTTTTSGPIVRSYLPTSSPSRMFPNLVNLLNNTSDPENLLPAVARTMNFRVVARDNLGGVWDDAMVLTVSGTTPFSVTAPNTAVTWSGAQTVTWNAAGTTAAPFNVANVRILCSTDGGNTWPHVLAASTPNDGSQLVTLPNVASTQARIKVEAIGNIFFDISNVNFTLQTTTPLVNLTQGTVSLSDTLPNGNSNGRADPGENNLNLSVQVVNTGGALATGVNGVLTSLTPTASVVSGASAYPNIATLGGTALNTTPYVIAVDSGHPCGTAVNLRLTVTSATTAAQNFDFSLSVGVPGGTVDQTFSYTGAVVAIPPAGTPISVALPVSGVAGTVTAVKVRFDGTSCNTTSGSTTVGLDHTWVGDLKIDLTSPVGTIVNLMNIPGGGTLGSSGNNFCQTVLDDTAGASIQSIAAAGAPYTGSFAPASPLSAFSGQNANGTWNLTLQDLYPTADNGSLRAFSLIITTTSAPVCDPPIGGGACNLADITGIGGGGAPPDGSLTVDDLIEFVNAFSDATGCPGTAPCNAADVTGLGGPPATADGDLTVDDLIAFVNAYSEGC